jgi:hypothetical protein
LIDTIEDEIDETYDTLVADFLIRVFVDCDYRLKTEDDELIVCDSGRTELFNLRDYIVKYLMLIDRMSQYEPIHNLIVNSHKIPHIATVKYLPALSVPASYDYTEQMYIGDKLKQD